MKYIIGGSSSGRVKMYMKNEDAEFLALDMGNQTTFHRTSCCLHSFVWFVGSVSRSGSGRIYKNSHINSSSGGRPTNEKKKKGYLTRSEFRRPSLSLHVL